MRLRLPNRIVALLLLVASGTLARATATKPPAQAAAKAPVADGDRVYGGLKEGAGLISLNHFTPVDVDALVWAAVDRFEGTQGVGASGAKAAGTPPLEALRSTLVRLRVARKDLDDTQVLALGLGAMTETLKDGSAWLEPADATKRGIGTPPPEAKRAGVGLVVKRGTPWPVVVRLIPEGPAARGGFPTGVELHAVDGQSTERLTIDEVAGLLQGPVGSMVLLRAGPTEGPLGDYTLSRAMVSAHQIDCRRLDHGILYVAIPSLSASTARQVQRWAVSKDLPPRLVILDLRDNFGGRLDAAGELADLFLAEGTILSVAFRAPKAPEWTRASPGTSPLEQAAVAVLVNAKTGSGAEAVAAALQDHRRAVVVGTQTAGKATIDTIYDLAGGRLKLTIAALHRSSGSPIDGLGVEPDERVAADAPPPAAPVFEESCPGFASAGPVARDPVVDRAVALLRGR